MSFVVEIFAKDRSVKIDDAHALSINSLSGSLGIMSNHRSINAVLFGDISIKTGHKKLLYRIDRGVIIFQDNRAKIVANSVEEVK